MRGRHSGGYHGRRTAPRRKKGPTAGDRLAALVVVCGMTFVLLVALKLLFPERAEALSRAAEEIMDTTPDLAEAFAAVGRAVSGDESVSDSLQNAYTAVFNPSGAAPERTAVDVDAVKAPGWELLCLVRDPLAEPAKAAAVELDLPLEAEVLSAQTVSASYWSPALPENASLEQRNLGFAYTSPVVGPLTSPFGWREHPITGGTRFHYGVDLAADTGTAIAAFADGAVLATGESSTLGKYIILSHEGGYRTLYAHCSNILVTSGAVTMGQTIAKVGETGSATGPHLHFELQNGTLYLNPIYYVALG